MRPNQLIQFRLSHILIATAFCCLGIAIAQEPVVVAIIYCTFLLCSLPVYLYSLSHGVRGNLRGIHVARNVSISILIAFVLTMLREDIRAYYSLSMWLSPLFLVAVTMRFQVLTRAEQALD